MGNGRRGTRASAQQRTLADDRPSKGRSHDTDGAGREHAVLAAPRVFVLRDRGLLTDMADFAPGEIAWVKMRGWPRWPCRVCDIEQAPSDVLAARTSTRPVLVHSFGDRKYVWAAASALTKYDPTAVVSAGNRLLQNAMIEAAQASGVAPPRMALAQPMRSKPEARARHTAAPQPAVAKPASSQPEHCPDRPAQHLRPRGRQPVLQSTFRHASKKRRTSKVRENARAPCCAARGPDAKAHRTRARCVLGTGRRALPQPAARAAQRKHQSGRCGPLSRARLRIFAFLRARRNALPVRAPACATRPRRLGGRGGGHGCR